jgi:hypothetical protein
MNPIKVKGAASIYFSRKSKKSWLRFDRFNNPNRSINPLHPFLQSLGNFFVSPVVTQIESISH